MSVNVNGKKVAGVGIPGLSPYQVAKAGGYTGTEQEFNEALANVGNIRDALTALNASLDALNGEVI